MNIALLLVAEKGSILMNLEITYIYYHQSLNLNKPLDQWTPSKLPFILILNHLIYYQLVVSIKLKVLYS